ncbi:LCP family protein [Streptococcaceae bacterium ESL0729]|nr:LCP family protein [Streptococcaceae bacterium ESL0729]
MGLAVTLIAAGVYAYTVVHKAEDIMSSTYDDLGLESTGVQFDASKPFSILLMGIDTGGEGREDPWDGRSDSMMVATVNPKTKETTLISLERDMLIDLVDTDGNSTNELHKLNDAYAIDGAKMSIANVQKLLNTDIDSYALINMEGLATLVDAVGGITVNNTLGETISIEETEPDYKATVEPGVQHINGDQALVYARMRHQDPEGDIGRQTRQREVISQVIKKLLSMDSISNYQKILKALSGNIKTNIKIDAGSVSHLLKYKDSLENINTIKLQGVGEMINEISYQVMPADNLLSAQNAVKRSLDEETSDKLDSGIVTFESYYGTYPSLYERPLLTIGQKGKTPVSYYLNLDGTESSETVASSASEEAESSSSN